MVSIHKKTFDQIVEQLFQTGTKQAKQRVWDYIAAMPTLYFVQCGRRSCSVPWITFEKDVPTAMVFTNFDHAIQSSKTCIEDGSNVQVVGLPTNAASMYIAAIASQGVTHVCFNHGPQKFISSIEEVIIAVGSMKR
ncbi:MAG: hypothetical protein VX436_00770 [Planctomycetota bacterium]|nr:hypothetical protein [Planctomycetota bacterium]